MNEMRPLRMTIINDRTQSAVLLSLELDLDLNRRVCVCLSMDGKRSIHFLPLYRLPHYSHSHSLLSNVFCVLRICFLPVLHCFEFAFSHSLSSPAISHLWLLFFFEFQQYLSLNLPRASSKYDSANIYPPTRPSKAHLTLYLHCCIALCRQELILIVLV